jgi:peptide/nickel transport system permease protein
MIADGRQYMRQAWWVSVIPGIAIFLVTASLSLLGDWLRDYFDPKLRQRAWE